MSTERSTSTHPTNPAKVGEIPEAQRTKAVSEVGPTTYGENTAPTVNGRPLDEVQEEIQGDPLRAQAAANPANRRASRKAGDKAEKPGAAPGEVDDDAPAATPAKSGKGSGAKAPKAPAKPKATKPAARKR
jgi:hypothetical protein